MYQTNALRTHTVHITSRQRQVMTYLEMQVINGGVGTQGVEAQAKVGVVSLLTEAQRQLDSVRVSQLRQAV